MKATLLGLVFLRTEYLVQPKHFYLGVAFFSGLILILILFMIFLLLRKKQILQEQKFIQGVLKDWLVDIILEEPEEDHKGFEVPLSIQELLEKPFAKQELLNELKRLKKSLSGQPGQNIEKLYLQLRLEVLSLRSLRSKYWFNQIKGIQELAIMNQKKYGSEILLLTNHAHPVIRMEAQLAMVCLQQYEGLVFFENLQYTLTQWHQVKLLQLLASQPLPAEELVHTWLQSSNVSVVQFTLKLIGEQHASNFQDVVIACLGHPEEIIRKQAIICLGEIPSPPATQALRQVLIAEQNKVLQLAILAEFIKSGEEVDVPFLKYLTANQDADIKLAAEKVLLQLQ